MALSDFIQSARDPLYSAGRYQQNPGFDYTRTPAVGGPSGYLEQNPDAVWTRYLSGRFGINPTDASARARWLRGQEAQVNEGFKAALAEDPTLIFQRYVNGLNAQDFINRFNAMLPSQRGENWSQYAGPSRWLSDL